jgi:Dimerisation domain
VLDEQRAKWTAIARAHEAAVTPARQPKVRDKIMSSAGTLESILELGYAFRGAKALMSAVELGVFTPLTERPLDCEALRQQLGLAERGARDFFDALVALGLLNRDETGRYSNAPGAALHLDAGKGSYVGGLFEHLATREYALWGTLTEALRTGRPQTGFNTFKHFESLYSDPQRLAFFVKAMTSSSLAPAKAIAARFPWDRYETFVDVGTAQGCVPVQIALAQPHISALTTDGPPLTV